MQWQKYLSQTICNIWLLEGKLHEALHWGGKNSLHLLWVIPSHQFHQIKKIKIPPDHHIYWKKKIFLWNDTLFIRNARFLLSLDLSEYMVGGVCLTFFRGSVNMGSQECRSTSYRTSPWNNWISDLWQQIQRTGEGGGGIDNLLWASYTRGT